MLLVNQFLQVLGLLCKPFTFLKNVEFWHVCIEENCEQDSVMAVTSQICIAKLKFEKEPSIFGSDNEQILNERMLHPLLCNYLGGALPG